MKTAVLFGVTLLASASSFAQTSPQPPGDPASKIITMTGCVGGSPESKAITLSDAMIIPGTPQPGQIDQTPSPLPPPVSADATEPVAGSAPVPSTTGTSGTKTTASSAAGTSTAAPSGVVTGTAPAGSSGASLTGYRLSGADMTPWIGQRVQVVGTFAPSAAATSRAVTAAPSTATSAPATPPALEFKVQTVRPATGPCPK